MFKFSVLMCVYIKEKPRFFYESLNSVFCNSIIPTETVIVYDGPVDSDINKIANEFKSRFNLKIIKLETNQGLGNALNEGLKYCTHDWVFRMDSDDVCDPDRFLKQSEAIMHDSSIDIIGGLIEEFDQELTISYGYRKVPKKNNDIHLLGKRRCPFNHMTVAFKKNKILEAGGYLHHEMMEDYNLWVRLLSRGVIAKNLDEVLVNVRAGNEMILRRRGVRYFRSEYKLMQLKVSCKFQPPLEAFIIFILRSFIRLLPLSIISLIYKRLR